MHLHPIPAFSDNYIWTLNDGQRAVVVDPGDAAGVMVWLQDTGLQLDAILLTHHHADHTGGVSELRQATGARVMGPGTENLPQPVQGLHDGESVQALGLSFEVLLVPGHTAGHIAYYQPMVQDAPLLFCGDTLFSGGCGRLFEGTPAQMLQSLNRLAALPDNTRVCCTHEYTLSNLRFALAVEPNNTALSEYQQRCMALRAQNLPTLPSSIGLEKQINPFLRTQKPAVQQAAMTHDPSASGDPVSVLATLREWKNTFK